MRALILSLAIAAAAVAPLWACPAAPDRSADLEPLFDQARAAPNEMAARVVSDKMWKIWTTAPDEVAQEMLRKGMSALRVADSLGAIATFDALTEYCPDYPEGYNQRAFVYFLNGEFESALTDLDRALALNPKHVAALSGRALTLTALGREDEAQITLRAALALNPWIPERALLKEPPGEEL